MSNAKAGLLDPSTRLSSHAQSITTLLNVLRSNDTFLLTSHSRPDGDAIGSVLGALYLLEAMGKTATVAMADPVPITFASLPGSERIRRAQPLEQADVALVMECDSVARTGFDHLQARLVVNIDHHRSGTEFADVNWIEPDAPAVGAMLFDLAAASGAPMSPALATCLYAAILTDTVHFTSASTTAGTFAIAERLIHLGANAAEVAEAVYHSYRPARLWILGAALRRLCIDGPIAWSAITCEEIDSVGAETEDCEGVVNYVVGVEGVRAGVFLRELGDGHFRVSLRSKGAVDVASIAEAFGGGGHQHASGCTVEGPLDEALDRLKLHLHTACAAATA